MEKELDFGRTVQMSMMPLTFPAFPKRKEIDIYAALYPAKELGGDFFDFFFIGKNKLCFAIGDVSDKGVPAALQMAVTKTLINSKALSTMSAGKIITEVNDKLSENNESCMLVTLFLGILDTDTGDLVYTNAGHNPPYLRRDDGNLERLDTRHGPVIGAMPDLTYKESQLRGDIVLTYTDGVTEAMDPDGNLFSEERLKKVLHNGNGQVTLGKLVKSLVSEVKDFEKGADQADDITVLSVQML
ncbi:MAG: PP2C family protein-serine/threonine phosphatase [Bacteroidetes bacterium]|nr:PP2C family protein-serine/threonine phosphatase [Bacteroidota bacterium]